MTNEAGGSWGEMDVLCKYLRDEMSAQKIGEIAEAAAMRAAYKRRLGAVEEDQAKVIHAIDTGLEERQVDVREYFDHRTGRICYVRQDTYHAEVRPMDDSERQVDLEANAKKEAAPATEQAAEGY